MLTSLPEPAERKNYVFKGWYTEKVGGRQVVAGEDMTGIGTLYAHWNYIAINDPEEYITPIPNKPKANTSGIWTIDQMADMVYVDIHPHFDSLEGLHEDIANVEFTDENQARHCAKAANRLKEGATLVDMDQWMSMATVLVDAIMACGEAVTIEFILNGICYRVVIPAGADLRSLADDNGYVCLACLAETFGFEVA